LVTFISLSLGAYQLSLVDLLSAVSSPFALKENVSAEDQTAIYLLWHIRIPRILMAILVGSGLAISGATVQTIFRNPLADPTLIGVSSGAMLFAVLFIDYLIKTIKLVLQPCFWQVSPLQHSVVG
jgi:iron complex transport system permease protein